MTRLQDLDPTALRALHEDLTREHGLYKSNRLGLDLTRGKPAADQLDLSAGLDAALNGNYLAEDGTDSRNYGALTGLAEARRLGAELMEVEAGQVICWGNSSLTLMHLVADTALRRGLWGDGRCWRRSAAPQMITPVPGYDRHFTVCDTLGIGMVNVAITDTGPDMDAVTALARDRDDIKGIWCVPKYSNPTGCIYADEVVAALAELPERAAADDFVVFWDNAYAVHDFEFPRAPLAPILELARTRGTEDHVVMFASTSKVTYPSGGLGFMAAGPAVLRTIEQCLSAQSIGPDKVNQLRHARFLSGRLEEHMAQHAALIKPKFELVENTLEEGLGGLGIASWTRPRGGYFVSLDTRPGLARRVGELAAEAGLAITRPGATFPRGHDPNDENIRIAPTFARLEDLDAAMAVLVLCIKLATVADLLERADR